MAEAVEDESEQDVGLIVCRTERLEDASVDRDPGEDGGWPYMPFLVAFSRTFSLGHQPDVQSGHSHRVPRARAFDSAPSFRERR